MNFFKELWRKFLSLFQNGETWSAIVLHDSYEATHYENAYVDLNYGGSGIWPIDVPSSIKFTIHMFKKKDDVYLSTEKQEKFWFIIPFTYDRANIHIQLTDASRNLEGKDLLGFLDHIVYDALRWNRNEKYERPTTKYISHQDSSGMWADYGHVDGYHFFEQIKPE